MDELEKTIYKAEKNNIKEAVDYLHSEYGLDKIRVLIVGDDKGISLNEELLEKMTIVPKKVILEFTESEPYDLTILEKTFGFGEYHVIFVDLTLNVMFRDKTLFSRFMRFISNKLEKNGIFLTGVINGDFVMF